MLSVVTWKWTVPGRQPLFSAVHVNALRAALERRLQVAHELICITDDPAGIDARVRIVPLPLTYAHTPRCRRRMQIFDRGFAATLGTRLLAMDLDMVLVDDITPLVQRDEPLVCARIDYARVYSGSFLLMDAGVLHGLWEAFRADPEGYPRRAWPRGIGSDQAMLNYYLRGRAVPHWGAQDGVVTFFGEGYGQFEHLGVGPGHPELPGGARVIVLGSADLAALEDPRYRWAREHWQAYAAAPVRVAA